MHNFEPSDYKCPLCVIANNQVGISPMFSEDDVVFRTEEVVAIISAYQWRKNAGNVVIFPVEHYENIFDLPIAYASVLQDMARGIAIAMKNAWSCPGISTRQHNGPAGNQDVWHYHLHVTPRYDGDDLYASYSSGKELMPAEERLLYAAELRNEMKG